MPPVHCVACNRLLMVPTRPSDGSNDESGAGLCTLCEARGASSRPVDD
jgi:hypothetical protein